MVGWRLCDVEIVYALTTKAEKELNLVSANLHANIEFDLILFFF